MIEGALVVVVTVVVVGAVLAVFWPNRFGDYALAIAVVISLPLAALLLLYKAFLIVLRGFGFIFQRLIKSVIFLVYGTVLTAVVGLSYPVPFIGRRAIKLKDRFTELIGIPGLVEELRFTRKMMVEIIEEQDERPLEHDTVGDYRDELRHVKKNGKEVLSAGESALSFVLAGLLSVSQIFRLGLFNVDLYGWAAAVLIQIGLIIVAISVVYRMYLMDFLAFNGDEEFSTIEQMDIALSYQKGVTKLAIVEHGMFMVLLVSALSDVDREIVRTALSYYYGDETSFFETMQFAWKLLRGEQSVR